MGNLPGGITIGNDMHHSIACVEGLEVPPDIIKRCNITTKTLFRQSLRDSGLKTAQTPTGSSSREAAMDESRPNNAVRSEERFSDRKLCCRRTA